MPNRSVRRPNRAGPTPMPSGGKPRRLEGDDLFFWASLQSDMRHLQEQIRRKQDEMQEFIASRSQDYRVTQNEGFDPLGYIVPGQQRPIQVQADQSGSQAAQESPESQS